MVKPLSSKVYVDASANATEGSILDHTKPRPYRQLWKSWSFRPGHFQEHLNRHEFRLCWLVIFLIYGLDSAFLVGMSMLYHWLLYTPDMVLSVESTLDLLPIGTLRVLMWTFPVLACCYLFATVDLVVLCVRRRRLALTYRDAHDEDDNEPEVTKSANSFVGVVRSVRATLRRFLNKWVFSVFSLDGKSFEIWFISQEILQILSQSYQCYLLSWFVTTRWINQLAVALTFLNCCSTPVIRLLVPHNLPRQRLLCVLCDCAIGFVQSVVIPLVMFHPYYCAFDTTIGFFPDKLGYIDTWYNEMVHQLDQLLLVSYFDFFTTVFPHMNFLASLRGARRLAKPIEEPPNARTATLIDVKPATGSPLAANGPLPQPRRDVLIKVQTSEQPSRHLRSQSAVGPRLYAIVCILYGVALIICHVVASIHNADASVHCRLIQNAWFVTKTACSVVNINCYRSHLQGNLSEMQTVLQRFDPLSVSCVILSHCPALEIPKALRSFENLGGLDIFNSTLVHWGAEAALDADVHRKLHYVTMEFVNLTSFPEGILGGNLPSTFSDVELHRTNLSSIPSDLGARWTNMWTLYVEYCELTELPETLSLMSLAYLSVAGNAIELIPDEIMINGAFTQFCLSNNPLQWLQQPVGDVDNLNRFFFEYTEVDQVPEWIMQLVVDRSEHGEYLEHSAFGSPFCREQSSSLLLANDSLVNEYRRIACAEDWQTSSGMIPVALIASQRPL